MNDDINEWLHSIGIDSTSPQQETSSPVVADTNSSSFTAEDFNDILADNGFHEERPTFDEAEEIWEEEEENTEEYGENQGEGRDLDAEEDADWQEAIDSGDIVPVVGPNNQRISMTEEEASQINAQETFVGDNQVHFHMPDGAIIDVPIIHNVATDLASANTDEEVAQVIANHSEESLIPPNSPTLLLNDSTSRFSGTEWYNEIQKSRIILAGCGGIGSWTVLQLARMNPSALFMYDDDVVEIANMSGQLYCQEDVGKAKVDAMADMIRSYTTMRNVFAVKDKFKPTSEAGDIMICGFDNMNARHIFFDSWRKHLLNTPEEHKSKCVYLDGRLSVDTLQVFCITGDNSWAINEYADHYLFSDSEADATQCSLKQTTYLACMIGSVIVNLFTNFIANTLNPIIPYDLPFFTEYDAQNMIFKTIK